MVCRQDKGEYDTKDPDQSMTSIQVFSLLLKLKYSGYILNLQVGSLTTSLYFRVSYHQTQESERMTSSKHTRAKELNMN